MFTLIAGPCVIESEAHVLRMAEALTKLTDDLGIEDFYFKASWCKANRTSGESYAGVNLLEGVNIFTKVREETGCKITTDIHESAQAPLMGSAVDVFQIPAMLSRQTSLLASAASYAPGVNIKKSQCASPHEMKHAVAKCEAVNSDCEVALIERGTSFGYNNLVVDFRSLKIMREENPGCPIYFDGTHSVQLPAGAGDKSTGERQFTPALCRAAIAVGVDGIFLETHDDPDNALSDGPNMVQLHEMKPLLQQLQELYECQNNL